jgi:hypothetical protein
MTGARLLQAFGEVAFNAIWWDNANPYPTDTSRGARPANIPHMANVLAKHCPLLVLTFGTIAKNGMSVLQSHPTLGAYVRALTVLHSPHPNAMGITQEELNIFALRALNTTMGD